MILQVVVTTSIITITFSGQRLTISGRSGTILAMSVFRGTTFLLKWSIFRCELLNFGGVAFGCLLYAKKSRVKNTPPSKRWFCPRDWSAFPGVVILGSHVSGHWSSHDFPAFATVKRTPVLLEVRTTIRNGCWQFIDWSTKAVKTTQVFGLWRGGTVWIIILQISIRFSRVQISLCLWTMTQATTLQGSITYISPEEKENRRTQVFWEGYLSSQQG